MAKFLYFRDTASSQYIVPVERLLGVDDTGSNTVVVQFEDLGGAASSSVVTLNVASGKEKDVMVALLNRVDNEKSDVLIVADDVDSNYVLSDISSIASIAHNQTSASGDLSVGGNLAVTGTATFTAGSQSSAVAVVATADGSGTGTISSGTAFALVASADANNIVVLPSPIIGNIVHIFAGTAFELRSNDPTTVAINGGTAAGAESEVGAGVLVKCVCTSATTWVANTFAADGTEAKLAAAGA